MVAECISAAAPGGKCGIGKNPADYSRLQAAEASGFYPCPVRGLRDPKMRVVD